MNPFDPTSPNISIPAGDIRLQSAYLNFLANIYGQQQNYQNQLQLLREQHRLNHNPWVEGTQAFFNPVLNSINQYYGRQSAESIARTKAQSDIQQEILKSASAANVANIQSESASNVARLPIEAKAAEEAGARARFSSGFDQMRGNMFESGASGLAADPFMSDADQLSNVALRGRQRSLPELMSMTTGEALGGVMGQLPPEARTQMFSTLNPLTSMRALADIGEVQGKTALSGAQAGHERAQADEIAANIAAGLPNARTTDLYGSAEANRALAAERNVKAASVGDTQVVTREIIELLRAGITEQGIGFLTTPEGQMALRALGTDIPAERAAPNPTGTTVDLALARDVVSREPGFYALAPNEQDARIRAKYHEIQLAKAPDVSTTSQFVEGDPFRTETRRSRPNVLGPLSQGQPTTEAPKSTQAPAPTEVPRPNHPAIGQSEALVRSTGSYEKAVEAIDRTNLPVTLKGYLKSYARQFFRAK